MTRGSLKPPPVRKRVHWRRSSVDGGMQHGIMPAAAVQERTASRAARDSGGFAQLRQQEIMMKLNSNSNPRRLLAAAIGVLSIGSCPRGWQHPFDRQCRQRGPVAWPGRWFGRLRPRDGDRQGVERRQPSRHHVRQGRRSAHQHAARFRQQRKYRHHLRQGCWLRGPICRAANSPSRSRPLARRAPAGPFSAQVSSLSEDLPATSGAFLSCGSRKCSADGACGPSGWSRVACALAA